MMLTDKVIERSKVSILSRTPLNFTILVKFYSSSPISPVTRQKTQGSLSFHLKDIRSIFQDLKDWKRKKTKDRIIKGE